MTRRAAWVLAVVGLLAGCVGPAEPAATEPVVVHAGPGLPFLEVANATAAPAEPAKEEARANPWPAGLFRITLDVQGEPAEGLVAVPQGFPVAIVVVAHGWGGTSETHRHDLEDLAARGALAVAMDYRGEQGAFKVRAGVEDTIAATRLMQDTYPAVDRTMLYGWSMGAEVAFLVVAEMPAGTFDYVFAGAGVSDLATFWGNPLVQPAVEAETGGPPHEVPAEYAWRSPVKRAAAIAAGAVDRVFLVHGDADPIVPIEASERLFQELTEAGQPTSFYIVTKDEWGLGCPLGVCLPTLAGPAQHEAGRYELLEPFIGNRLQRLPDPSEATVRGTYDGESGEYEPSDVGP